MDTRATRRTGTTAPPQEDPSAKVSMFAPNERHKTFQVIRNGKKRTYISQAPTPSTGFVSLRYSKGDGRSTTLLAPVQKVTDLFAHHRFAEVKDIARPEHDQDSAIDVATPAELPVTGVEHRQPEDFSQSVGLTAEDPAIATQPTSYSSKPPGQDILLQSGSHPSTEGAARRSTPGTFDRLVNKLYGDRSDLPKALDHPGDTVATTTTNSGTQLASEAPTKIPSRQDQPDVTGGDSEEPGDAFIAFTENELSSTGAPVHSIESTTEAQLDRRPESNTAADRTDQSTKIVRLKVPQSYKGTTSQSDDTSVQYTNNTTGIPLTEPPGSRVATEHPHRPTKIVKLTLPRSRRRGTSQSDVESIYDSTKCSSRALPDGRASSIQSQNKSKVVRLKLPPGWIPDAAMQPVRDPNDVSALLKSVVDDLYDIQSKTHGYIPETQNLLVDKVEDIATKLAHLQEVSDPKQTPNHPIHNVRIAPEIIDYVDEGRNPDIFTREFVENVQRGNAVINGKKQAFRDFSIILAQKMKEGIGGIDRHVDQIMERAGLTRELAEAEKQAKENKDVAPKENKNGTT
jgi:mediator of RNA polymerase II transcription subunit 10